MQKMLLLPSVESIAVNFWNGMTNEHLINALNVIPSSTCILHETLKHEVLASKFK